MYFNCHFFFFYCFDSGLQTDAKGSKDNILSHIKLHNIKYATVARNTFAS